MRIRQMILCGVWAMSLMALTSNGWAQNSEPKAVWGKYVNSMVLKTRTAATYPKGLFVITLVSTYQDMDHSTNRDLKRKVSSSMLWLEYGVTNRFQVGIYQPYTYWKNTNLSAHTHTSEDGFGDTTLYAKGRLKNETKWVPAITLDGFLKVPVGDKSRSLSTGKTDITTALAVSKRWNRFSVHVNPEYVFTGGTFAEVGASADDKKTLNVGAMWHAIPKLTPMMEYNAYWWGRSGNMAEAGGGVLWLPTKNTSLKFGISTPVQKKNVTWAADWTPWTKLAVWF